MKAITNITAMDINSIRQSNIKELIAEYGSQARLVEMINKGLSPNEKQIDASQISNAINQKRPFGDKICRKVERALNLERYWLESISRNDATAEADSIYNVEPGLKIRSRIPLISWVQAGEWSEIFDSFELSEAEEWRESTARVSSQAFALRVKGDSMTNPYGTPTIPDGSVVIVDPAVRPESGSIIVARLDEQKEATIKKLVIDVSNKYLVALNPNYRSIEIDDNCTIIGVVKKVEIDF